MPPSYRERLRLEGAWLTTVGLAGSAALLATSEQAHRWPWNTAGQLAVTAGLVAWLAPRGARKAIDGAVELRPDSAGTGEPTPLWMHPLIVAGLALPFALAGELGVDRAGLDACLRVTLGSAIVGLGQSVLLAGIVKRDEETSGRRYFRIVGSQGLKTKLGWLPA